ncbi:MAG: transposase [Proteobacteria bacterium]|nr:transposase [Pseudomonadota bacterium]
MTLTIEEHCRRRAWELLAVNARSNHVHVVVRFADVAPEKMMGEWKAWCTRRLRESGVMPSAGSVWTRHGSTRYLWKERELAPAIAVGLGVTAMTNCVDVGIEDGAVVVTRPFFDGTQHAKIVLEGKGPPLVALQAGATPTVELGAREVAVRPVAVDLSAVPARGQVLEVIEEAPGDVDITKAEIIVAVGRGIGGKEKIAVIEELTQALGGLMACSRPLVDLGWLGRERQVGASGKSVAPKVYLACGISGASQHLSGMSESRLIVAINKDPNAPIFQVAHYGVVGDLLEIVPALTAEARKVAG